MPNFLSFIALGILYDVARSLIVLFLKKVKVSGKSESE